MIKQYPTLGCCGLDCGLCPRYYTKGSSRCPGCCGENFSEKHPSCSFITCCVKKKGLEVCAECEEFPCTKFHGDIENDSFITHRRIIHNQNFIKESGITAFTKQQNKRIKILQSMLECYDDGRSKSFFCLAVVLLSCDSLSKAIEQAEQEVKHKAINQEDRKSKAKILKSILNKFAAEENEELRINNSPLSCDRGRKKNR